MDKKQLQRIVADMLGGLVVIMAGDGLKVRRKRGPGREKVLTAPSFENTRECNADFATAGKTASLLRNLLEYTAGINDKNCYRRMVSQVCKVLKGDLTNEPGKKKFRDGALHLLTGFQFNSKCAFGSKMPVKYQTSVNRESGTVQVVFAPFSIRTAKRPPGATHFVLYTNCATLDVSSRGCVRGKAETLPVAFDGNMRPEAVLDMALPVGTDLPVVVAVGVRYVLLENGRFYELTNNEYSAQELAAVDVIR